MILTCSECGKKLNVPDSSAGTRGKCPACGTIVNIPESPESAGTESTDATKVTATPPANLPSSEHVTDEPGPFETSSRRRDGDDDADDDDFEHRRIRRGADGPNPLAITAMILGIISITLAVPGICCCGIIIEPLAAVGGIAAIICGVFGKTPGSEGYAKTGIICGSLALVCVLLAIIVMIVALVFQFQIQQGGFG